MPAGTPPPCSPGLGELSSLPTHTPVTSPSAKPTNQASRLSCVVPVLPKVSTLSRSEEHTSELQLLMRISYAVFCLKKKNKTNNPTDIIFNRQHIILH